MGGRSAAAKGSTLEPPGRPPRPSSANSAEPPEPRSEPGPRNLVPTEPQSANPSTLQPGANPPQRFSGRVHKAAALPRTHPAAELLLLLLGASAAAWEHLGAGAEEKAAVRRVRPKRGTAPPASRPDTPTPRSHWSLPTPAPSRPRLRPQPTRPRKRLSKKQPGSGSQALTAGNRTAGCSLLSTAFDL